MDSCRRTGIDTIVRVRDGRWEVLTLASGAGNEVRVLSSDRCSITRDVERRCPMLREPLAGQHCHMHGGPWTSSSMTAAAAWKDHQQRLVAATGCDTCRGETYVLQGKFLRGGGPIALFPVPEPTRWLVADTRPLVMKADEVGVE